MPGGERSMKGCIAREASGAYFLVPQRGKKVQLNSSEDIVSHVDQQVRISGAFVDAYEADAKSSAGGGSSNGTGKRPVREFHVVKVDVITATCPLLSAKKK